MKVNGKIITLQTSDLKILRTVYELNCKQFYPLSEGVYKILSGVDDEETKEYTYVSTYKTLISYNSKKVSRFIVMLLRYGYLEKIYDKSTDELYLKISDKGLVALLDYQKKHKYKFKEKAPIEAKTIVKITK